jgi:hypothetical protein
MPRLPITLLSVLLLAGCSLPSRKLLVYPTLLPKQAPTVKLEIDGHVAKPGIHNLPSSLTLSLSELIKLAGGFQPSSEFRDGPESTVAWIERELPAGCYQLILLDYKNRQILSQRDLKDGKNRNERYRWRDFRFVDGDVLFVTTSRNSLDLAGYGTRWVSPTGWPGIEKLGLFGMTREETDSYEANHRP